jgi:hypothetical protein
MTGKPGSHGHDVASLAGHIPARDATRCDRGRCTGIRPVGPGGSTFGQCLIRPEAWSSGDRCQQRSPAVNTALKVLSAVVAASVLRWLQHYSPPYRLIPLHSLLDRRCALLTSAAPVQLPRGTSCQRVGQSYPRSAFLAGPAAATIVAARDHGMARAPGRFRGTGLFTTMRRLYRLPPGALTYRGIAGPGRSPQPRNTCSAVSGGSVYLLFEQRAVVSRHGTP